METCVCTTIRQLASGFDEHTAAEIAPALNEHLRLLWIVLTKSKLFSREIQYYITPINHRTAKVLSIRSVDTNHINELLDKFEEDIDGFWQPSGDLIHTEIRRRIACISIFLRYKLDPEAICPPHIARLTEGQNLADLRYAGRKYIKMARKLGDIGAICWLPSDIPPSTYERYLNMNDEETFNHLKSISPTSSNYNDFVQRLVMSQLNDNSLSVSYLNLCSEYGDMLPDSEIVVLLICALGGVNVPSTILRRVPTSQRRWTADGEIKYTSALEFDLPPHLTSLLSNETRLSKALSNPNIRESSLEDGSITWSINQRTTELFRDTLQPIIMEELTVLGLRLMCFTCPPCYECNLGWSPAEKRAILPLLDKATDDRKIPSSLRLHAVEAFLYLSERDSITIRRRALERARVLSRKSLPYYIYASIALFYSFLHRLDGDLAKADTVIRNFFSRNQQPSTRIDHALKGRLHISQIDNKIKRYDDDIPMNIYAWEGIQPLSTLESEVTFRLHSAVGKYFLSIGDFKKAQESLNQYLHLNLANSLSANPTTRRLIISRTADMDCELGEYERGLGILQPEVASMSSAEKTGRPFIRLILSSVDIHLRKGEMDVSEALLWQLTEPLELDDITNQILHMRKIMAAARIAHQRLDWDEALRRWTHVLQELNQLVNFKTRHGFIASIIYISIAHTLLHLGNEEGAKGSWAAAMEILNSAHCEYWIPVVATSWLSDIVTNIHQKKGWSLRLVLPGKSQAIILPHADAGRSPSMEWLT